MYILHIQEPGKGMLSFEFESEEQCAKKVRSIPIGNTKDRIHYKWLFEVRKNGLIQT